MSDIGKNEPMTVEEEAHVRRTVASGDGIDGPPDDPLADLVRRLLATIDALRATVAAQARAALVK